MEQQPRHATRRTIGPEISARVAARVLERREALGWTRDELSHKMYDAGYDMSAAVIRNLENGMLEGRMDDEYRARWVTVDEAAALANVLGVTVRWLMDELREIRLG